MDEKTEESPNIGVSVDDLINSILEEKGIEAKAEEPIEEKEDNQTDGADDATADVLSEVEEEAEKEPEEEVEEPKEEKPDPIQKRIDKLTAQKKAAEEKAESHRSELEQLREELKSLKEKVESPEDKPAPVSENDPLGSIVTKEDLSKKLSEVREIKKWARANKNGGFIGDKEYTAEQVDNMLDWADDMITEHIPARLGYIGQLESASQQAQTAYPELLKKGTEDNKSYNQYLRQFPEIKKFPDYQMVIGDAIAGQKARSQKAVKALSKAPAKAPPATPRPSTAPKQSTKSPASSPTSVGPLSAKNIDAFLLNLVS